MLDQKIAGAATGGNFILGQSNNANVATVLVPTIVGQSSALLAIDGSNLASTQTSMVVTGPGGLLAPAMVVNGRAGGVGIIATASSTATTIGIAIEANAAGGDLFASGSGRLLQTPVPSGPPAFASNTNESVRDTQGAEWLSDGGGGWAPTQFGGKNIALFSAVIVTQKALPGSNGSTWVDMDAANLHLTIIPKFHCQAVVSVNADLWTFVAGVNQDIGVRATSSTAPPGVGLYPTVAGQPEAWKESGGPNAFSPNAAYLETVLPMRAGLTYNLFVVWKASKPTGGSIVAGAGPVNGTFSPTRMSVRLVTDSHSNVGAKPLEPPAKKPVTHHTKKA